MFIESIFPYIFVLFIFIFFAFIPTNFFTNRRMKKIDSIQNVYDRSNAYKDLPRPVRSLTEKESETLRNLHGSFVPIPNWKKEYRKIAFFIGLVIFGAIITMNDFALEGKTISILTLLGDSDFLVGVVAIIIIFIITVYLILNKYKYYLDLRSPVFGTTGILTMHWITGSTNDDTYFKIRDVTITKNYSDFVEYLKKIPEGHDVYVEYSPHTKQVWTVR